MKWVVRLFAVLAFVFVAVAIYAVASARRTEKPVGFQVVQVDSASGPMAVAMG